MGLEESSMGTQDKSLRKAEGANKNFQDYSVGVHKKCIRKIINLNIFRLNLKVN